MHMDLKNIDNFHLFLGTTPNVSKEQKLKERSVHAWEMVFLDVPVPEGSVLGPFLFGNLGFV